VKLRHAAALALVGWYLMVPPPIGKGEMIDLKAPLAKWNHWGESPFKTEKDCYNWQQQFLGMMVFSEEDSTSNFAQLNASRCIASDDPRLKGK
jgi:hypothetical protein